MTSRWAPFPNVDGPSGAYDYFSQTISLDSVSEEKFAAALRDDFYARLDVWPLLIHEMQHFVDHATSVWGRNMLARLFNAYKARMSDSLDEYWRIPEMLRELKTVHYDDYYTDVTDAAEVQSDGSPWQYRFTAGFQLDGNGRRREDKPILFTQFTRPGIEPYICRVPFSVASLLEVRAMAAELAAGLSVFNQEKNGDDLVRRIDFQNWSMKRSSIAYDPHLAVYTVAAHYFTGVLNTREFYTTYSRAAAAAWLCLNLPGHLFARLEVPAAFAELEKHWSAFRANEDRGFLYACLVEHGRGTDTSDMNNWLDGALAQAGLPSLADVRASVDKARLDVHRNVHAGPYSERLNDVLNAGMHYAGREPNGAGLNYTFAGGDFPPVLLEGGKFMHFPRPLAGPTFAEPGDWFGEAFRLQNKMRQFVDACII